LLTDFSYFPRPGEIRPKYIKVEVSKQEPFWSKNFPFRFFRKFGSSPILLRTKSLSYWKKHKKETGRQEQKRFLTLF